MSLSLNRVPKFDARSPRTAVWMPTVLLLPDDRELPVEVRNVSSEGFMGRALHDLRSGTSLGLEIPNFGIVRATIRWSDDGKLGAFFEAPLDLDWFDLTTARAPVPLPMDPSFKIWPFAEPGKTAHDLWMERRLRETRHLSRRRQGSPMRPSNGDDGIEDCG